MQKSNEYLRKNPEAHLLRLGVGDVTLPLPEIVIKALHDAVDDQSKKETFHGYMYECGDPTLRETIAVYYSNKGIKIDSDEVFISGIIPRTLIVAYGVKKSSANAQISHKIPKMFTKFSSYLTVLSPEKRNEFCPCFGNRQRRLQKN